jgi:hypothetical protein
MQQASGLRSDQVSQVRGFADHRLRNLKDSMDLANRRISIIVQYIDNNADEAGTTEEDTKVPQEGNPSADAKANIKNRETTDRK